MRICIRTIKFIGCITLFVIHLSMAMAQAKIVQKKDTAVKLLPNSSYSLIPGANYAFYNVANGHKSDLRLKQSITLITETPEITSNSNTHTTSLVTQAAPDGNSGFHLQLTKDKNNYAQTGFYFMSSANDKYVVSEDALQLIGPGATVFLSSFSSDGINLCINTMSDYVYGKKMRLYVNASTTGTYMLSLADFNEIDTNSYTLSLIDNQKQDSINLLHQSYSFNINVDDTTTFGAWRFLVSIQHKSVPAYELKSFLAQKVSTGVQLNWSALNAGDYTGYTLQKLKADESADSLYFIQSDTGTTDYSFVDFHPLIGNNVYRLKQNGITGGIIYSNTVTIGYNNSSPHINLSLYPNPGKTTMNANLITGTSSTSGDVAYIYNSMGNLIKHEAVPGPTWSDDISSFKTGLYFIQVKDSNGNIVAQSKFIKNE